MRIGVLASHEGTTLQAVLDATARGEIGVEVGLVVSNNADSGALRRARASGMPTAHLSGRTHPEPAALDSALAEALARSGAEVVLLAGYMKQLGPETLAAFRGRILNTHPALLPRFGGRGMHGLHVHRAVLAAGERVTGASVHVVEAEYDTGPVVARAEVPILPGDTPEVLAARVQDRERALVVETLGLLASGRLALPR